MTGTYPVTDYLKLLTAKSMISPCDFVSSTYGLIEKGKEEGIPIFLLPLLL